MKCPKCDYVFSEENRVCPRCGEDVGEVLERIGFFPKSSDVVFFKVEDILKAQESPATEQETLSQEVSEEVASQPELTLPGEELTPSEESTTDTLQQEVSVPSDEIVLPDIEEIVSSAEDSSSSGSELELNLEEFKAPADEVSLPEEESFSEDISQQDSQQDLLFPEGEISIPADNIPLLEENVSEPEEKEKKEEEKKEIEFPFPED